MSTTVEQLAAVGSVGVVIGAYAVAHDVGLYVRVAQAIDRAHDRWVELRTRWTIAGNTVDAVTGGWIPGADVSLLLVDHAECENPDCSNIICCCLDTLGGADECPGTTTQGCPHHNLLCWDCRLECMFCVLDCRDDAGVLR